MYTPMGDEKKKCINIVKELLNSSDDECKRYSDEIFFSPGNSGANNKRSSKAPGNDTFSGHAFVE